MQTYSVKVFNASSCKLVSDLFGGDDSRNWVPIAHGLAHGNNIWADTYECMNATGMCELPLRQHYGADVYLGAQMTKSASLHAQNRSALRLQCRDHQLHECDCKVTVKKGFI